jgi:hypothetical protein
MKENCQKCKKPFDLDALYEYRGFVFCEEHFNEGQVLVEEKRAVVMEVVGRSVHSQRAGEFVNNRHKYHLGNVASDGLPRIKPNEPQILKDYEAGVL